MFACEFLEEASQEAATHVFAVRCYCAFVWEMFHCKPKAHAVPMLEARGLQYLNGTSRSTDCGRLVQN